MDLTPGEARGVAVLYAMVEKRGDDECWPWRMPLKGRQRPKIYWGQKNGKVVYKPATHVVLWLETGKWPSYVEHTCDNGVCCNLRHLVDSDHGRNMQSMVDRGRHANQQKTHCPVGHSYAEHGAIRHRGDGSPFRVCNRCILEDTWKRRGGPSAKSQGIDLHPVCPKCGGSWTYYGIQGRRKCTPCANEKQRKRRG